MPSVQEVAGWFVCWLVGPFASDLLTYSTSVYSGGITSLKVNCVCYFDLPLPATPFPSPSPYPLLPLSIYASPSPPFSGVSPQIWLLGLGQLSQLSRQILAVGWFLMDCRLKRMLLVITVGKGYHICQLWNPSCQWLFDYQGYMPPALRSPDLSESAFKRALFSTVQRPWDIFTTLAPNINIQIPDLCTYLLKAVVGSWSLLTVASAVFAGVWLRTS